MPDLTWRMATWTRAHRRPPGHLRPLPGQRAGRRRGLAARARRPAQRVALLTYGSPLERLYGRWFPAYFGPAAAAPRCTRRSPAGATCGGSPTPSAARSGCAGDTRARGRPRARSTDPLAYGRDARDTRCPHRSSATPTTRRTPASPRNAPRCWRGCAPGPRQRPTAPRASSGQFRQVLRVEQRQVVRGRLGAAGRPGPRAAPPSPRRSAARCGRCRRRGPWGAP